MKTIGIAAHSAEGGALCFITACREGGKVLGEHNHPEIIVSAIPMSISMPAWNSDDHDTVAKHLGRGVQHLADAGADFFICPDNTAHIVLEKAVDDLALPGLHIAEVVCTEIKANGWSKAALLGTNWTMTGPVYKNILDRMEIDCLIPGSETRQKIHDAIFNELCNGEFTDETTQLFVEAIEALKRQGAECVILGCTEIPLIITEDNSPLPILDSTRLLAKYAVMESIKEEPATVQKGWIPVQLKD
ncbi:MAG: amino acid racemase [Roseivirga sp.]|nr:amino acid racemase [Roseivirga sp.]